MTAHLIGAVHHHQRQRQRQQKQGQRVARHVGRLFFNFVDCTVLRLWPLTLFTIAKAGWGNSDDKFLFALPINHMFSLLFTAANDLKSRRNSVWCLSLTVPLPGPLSLLIDFLGDVLSPTFLPCPICYLSFFFLAVVPAFLVQHLF